MSSLGEATCALSAGVLAFSLTLAWLRRPTSPGRFLLYDTKFGEGFNLQREVYPRVAWLAGELNRELDRQCGQETQIPQCARWAVVLPPWCRVAHWGPGTAPLPWSEFFDPAALHGTRVPLVEFHEYVQDTGSGTVDLAIVLTDETSPGQRFFSGSTGKFLRWADDLSLCSADHGGSGLLQQARDPLTGRFNLTFAGRCKGGVEARELRCGVLDSPFPRGVLDMLRKLDDSTVRSVMLKNYDSFLAPDDEEMDSLGLRESMLFSAEIRRIGDEFIARAFQGRPYLAAHCRRTDFLRAQPTTTPAADAVAEQLNSAVVESGLDQVFVATDAPEDLRKRLQERVNGTVHFFEEGRFAGAMNQPGKQAIAEMWVAARADFFIGTAESRFSMWIQLERGFLGWPVDTSEQEFCKTAGTRRCICPKNRHPVRRAPNRKAYHAAS